VLAERHEVGIKSRPKSFGQFFPECHLHFQRRFRIKVAKSVENTVYVHVDAYRRFFERHGDHKVCGFAAYAGEFCQFVDILRDLPVKFAFENGGKHFQVARFASVKTDRVYQFLQLFFRQSFQITRIFHTFKKLSGDRRGGFVLGPGAQNRGYQHLKRIAGLHLYQVDHRSAVLFEFRGENVVDGFYL
jgi:hypothetical protein